MTEYQAHRYTGSGTLEHGRAATNSTNQQDESALSKGLQELIWNFNSQRNESICVNASHDLFMEVSQTEAASLISFEKCSSVVYDLGNLGMISSGTSTL